MDPFFAWLETSALSVWVRETPSIWVFPFLLVLHTVGLAFLVGVNVAVALRVLGVASRVPVASLERYYQVMWLGFWINAASGVLLLIAYPTKALTNPLFYAKLTLIGVGLGMALVMRRLLSGMSGTEPGAPTPSRMSRLAAYSLACWVAVIFAGRLLAYTCTRLMWDSPC
jgi:hypothetical protein